MKLAVACSAILLTLAAAAPIAQLGISAKDNLPAVASIVERGALPNAALESRSDVSDCDEHPAGAYDVKRDAAAFPGFGEKLKAVKNAPKKAANAVKKGAEKSWDKTKSGASCAAQKILPDPSRWGSGPALGNIAWRNNNEK